MKQCCVYFLIFFTKYFSNAVTGNSDRLTWGIWTTFSVTDDLNSFQLFTVKSIHRLLSKTKGPISLPILLLICYDKYNKNIHMTGNNNNSHFTFKVKPIWNRIFSHIRHNGLKQTKWMILRWKYAKCGTGFSRKYTLEQQFLKTILVSETLSFNPITGQYSKKSTWPRSHDWQKATLASDSSMGNTQPVRSKASHIEKHCEVC